MRKELSATYSPRANTPSNEVWIVNQTEAETYLELSCLLSIYDDA